jgi:proteasome lid subunit RPN8/RPN11
MLQVSQFAYDQLHRHGERAYPHECCGVLLGSINPDAKIVVKAIPAANISSSPRNHYEIDPVELIRILRNARAANLEIVGFYHSHPDHPAHWSSTDLAEAHWLGCSYVITAIAQGCATLTNSFHLAGHREEDKHFESEEIQIQAPVPART